MIDYRVAVPSHDRAATLAAKTLPTLARLGVPADRIDVWVDPVEIDAYRATLDPGLYAELHPGALGLRAQLEAIRAGYPADAPVVKIDDDLDDVVVKTGDQSLASIGDLDAFVVDAFGTLARLGLRLWGVYLPPNAFFMREAITTDLRLCCGGLYGRLNSHDPAYRHDLDERTDYETTCRHYLADGGVVRFGGVSIKTRTYHGTGGMQNTRTPESSRASALALADEFPGLAHPYRATRGERARRGNWEIRLRDKR
jgi:hypothetical protein